MRKKSSKSFRYSNRNFRIGKTTENLPICSPAFSKKGKKSPFKLKLPQLVQKGELRALNLNGKCTAVFGSNQNSRIRLAPT